MEGGFDAGGCGGDRPARPSCSVRHEGRMGVRTERGWGGGLGQAGPCGPQRPPWGGETPLVGLHRGVTGLSEALRINRAWSGRDWGQPGKESGKQG